MSQAKDRAKLIVHVLLDEGKISTETAKRIFVELEGVSKEGEECVRKGVSGLLERGFTYSHKPETSASIDFRSDTYEGEHTDTYYKYNVHIKRTKL